MTAGPRQGVGVTAASGRCRIGRVLPPPEARRRSTGTRWALAALGHNARWWKPPISSSPKGSVSRPRGAEARDDDGSSASKVPRVPFPNDELKNNGASLTGEYGADEFVVNFVSNPGSSPGLVVSYPGNGGSSPGVVVSYPGDGFSVGVSDFKPQEGDKLLLSISDQANTKVITDTGVKQMLDSNHDHRLDGSDGYDSMTGIGVTENFGSLSLSLGHGDTVHLSKVTHLDFFV